MKGERRRMLIVSKDYSEAYNLAHITNFYIGSDGTTIKASAGTTRGGILGKYNSFEETKTALKIMLCEINKKDNQVVYMPNDNDVSTVIKRTPEHKHHHISGKKTKGHGGS